MDALRDLIAPFVQRTPIVDSLKYAVIEVQHGL